MVANNPVGNQLIKGFQLVEPQKRRTRLNKRKRKKKTFINTSLPKQTFKPSIKRSLFDYLSASSTHSTKQGWLHAEKTQLAKRLHIKSLLEPFIR